MKEKLKRSQGITLIALVITIIILLILAGISISALTGSGLFGKAQWAVKLTKIREIEEAANLAYMARQIDEFTKGEVATIAGVISDLKAQGYNIEQRTSGSNTVTGIELNESNVKMNKGSEEILTYTLVYGEETVRYFAEIDGKYYEMIFENGEFKINTEETDLEGINKEPKITAKSNAENIVTARAEKIDNIDKIILNSLNELGETTITIKEENSGIATVCNVKVMTLIQSITFNQGTINIEKGDNVELNTLVTINPTDATEELIWTTENGEIVEITEEGRLVGVKEGTTTIKVTNEDGTIEATCQVKVVISATGISLNKSTATINRGNTDSLTVTITPADTTDPVTWTSEKTGVATITPDATGRTATIRAIGAGTSRITVTCGSKTAYCTVTVKVPATGLTISQTSATVKVGSTLRLTATATPSDTTDTITWKSSNTSVATVSNLGLITGLKVGTATITATCGSQSKTCNVKVERFSGLNTSNSNPEGAMPSGNVTIVESDASKGIVIRDKNNREWVWIQVPKLTVFKTAKSSTDYTNIYNDLVTYAGVYRKGSASQKYSWKDAWYSGCGIADATTYNTMGYKMLSSVYTNGGFWIQRYEDGTTAITCANAQKKASGYAPDSTKTSSLLFGIQWDLVCKYLEVYGGLTTAVINSDSSSWGRYINTSKIETGSSTALAGLDRNKKMNIYDFAGNLYEWTLEQATNSSSFPCSARGGCYPNEGIYSASYRYGWRYFL